MREVRLKPKSRILYPVVRIVIPTFTQINTLMNKFGHMMQGKPIHCLFSLFSISSTCTLHKVWQYPDLARSAFSTCLTGSSHFFTSHQYPLSSRLFQCYSDAVQTQIPSFREDYPQLRSTNFKSEHQVSRTQMIVAFPDSRSTT
jgi:hypothetical protein